MAALVDNSWPDGAHWWLKIKSATEGMRSSYFFFTGRFTGEVFKGEYTRKATVTCRRKEGGQM